MLDLVLVIETRQTRVGDGSATGSVISAPRLRFDRNEFAGAFGDLGTDLPLIVGVTLAAGLDATSVLVLFGVMQILTGLRYRIPMPVQPLKAMAAIVIAQGISGPVLFGAGLAVGLTMLVLSLTGGLDWLARVIPKAVVRGIQFGLGLQLSLLALSRYVQADGLAGYALAAVAFVIALALLGNRRYPAALLIVGLGAVYALIFDIDLPTLAGGFGFALPGFHLPRWQDIVTGFVVLALPQIPLSLGNSILATRQIAEDLFPGRRLTTRQIGLTYALMNLVNPFFGGVPTCHGSGGMAGHYAFGARTGGSVIVEGTVYVAMGLFFGRGFESIVAVFPMPVLGVILLFEGLALMRLIRDSTSAPIDLTIVLLVGLIAAALPYGYLIGMVVGAALSFLARRRGGLAGGSPGETPESV